METPAVKPRLVLGLGNEIAGDDGIGVRVVERLATHPRLPGDVEARAGGSDLFRSQSTLHGREHVVLVDAVLGSETPGTVVPLDPDDPLLGDQGGAHQLSPTAALAVLRVVDPELRNVPMTLAGVVIARAEVTGTLSPELAGQVDTIVERVLELVDGTTPRLAGGFRPSYPSCGTGPERSVPHHAPKEAGADMFGKDKKDKKETKDRNVSGAGARPRRAEMIRGPGPGGEERRTTAWIGASIVVRGDLTSSEDMTVAGRIEGDVAVPEHTLVVAPGARIRGDVTAKTVAIHGEVTGTITGKRLVEVGETASVDGDIVTPRMKVAEGAALTGRMRIATGGGST